MPTQATGTCQRHLCTERSRAQQQSFSSPGEQPGVPFSTAPGTVPGFSVGVLQEPVCAQVIFSPRAAFVHRHCRLRRALQGGVADLVDLSPVTLQTRCLISFKDSTRTVTEHGGKPATLKPRAAKSYLDQGWQAPACGWFENQFPIAPAGMTSVVSPTKILRSRARQLLSLKNYQWRFSGLPSNKWPAGLKRNEEDLP